MKALKVEKETPPIYVAENAPALGRSEVAKGYAWNATLNFIGKLIFPIIGIFFYRKLGPAQMGIYAVLLPIYMICDSLRDAGLSLTYVADRSGDTNREGQYATLAMLNACLFAALTFVFRFQLAALFRMPELHWGLEMVAIAILLTGMSTIPANKLQKLARFRDASIVDFLSTLSSFVLALALVFLGFGFKALIWQFVFRSLTFTVGCWLIQPVHLKWVKFEVLKAVWKNASHNLLNNLLYTIYTVADNLLVTRLFGGKIVGNYNAAYSLGMKPVDFFSSPLAKTLLIAYTRKSHDKESLTDVFTRTIAVSILAMVPLYAIMGVFARPLTVWIYTTKYPFAGPALAVLVLYCACRSVGLLCGNVLVAMNKPAFNVYGWILGYATVAAILLLNLHRLTLMLVVEALTAGAAVSYSTTAFAAFRILKPKGANAKKLWQAMGISSVSLVLAVLSSLLPFGDKIDFAVAIVCLPVIQLLSVAYIYTGSAKTGLSKAGLKQIYHAI
jgi:O-antigen/teichoic acid export membrane protein